MADERQSELEETADEMVVAEGESSAEPLTVRETVVVEQTPGDEVLAVEERVTTIYPEATVETAPDMEPIPAADEDEFIVVERRERVVTEAAAVEPQADLEEFTTLQAVTLAFLVLLNIIVIGLGIWQVSRYFGWL